MKDNLEVHVRLQKEFERIRKGSEVMNKENNTKRRGFEVVVDEHRKTDGTIKLPTRADKGSAGYDFYAADTFTVPAGGTGRTFTDVKAYMETDEVLMIHVRSSIGIKKNLILSNATGVIDSTYYSNESNDGNIGIFLTNLGDEDVTIQKGERIAQGIFMNYLTTSDDKTTNEVRSGGIGSSGK